MSYKPFIRAAVIVGLILFIPLILTIRDGAVEGVGWNWTLGDFIAMGTLLYIAGLCIEFALYKLSSPLYRTVAVVGILGALCVIWVELAVDGVSRAATLLLG